MFKQALALCLALIATATFAAVDVNKADQAQLETVTGIGPATAGKILNERKKGAFKDWNDMIDRVQGVGSGNATKLSTNGLTVNGAPYKAAGNTAPQKAGPATAPAKR